MSNLRVGIVGVGNMGLNMARRLLDGGYEVHARDIRPEAEAEAARYGALVEPSPAALARTVDVVLIVVVDAAQIERVLFEPASGAIETLRTGQTVVLSSTIAPRDAAGFAGRLAARGVDCLDAPISGGPKRAREGTISLMCAGGAEARDRLRPVLERLASRVFTISETPGDAAKAKLVNNLLAAINLVAGASALALSARVGLDQKAMYALICASSGHSWVFADRMGRALADDYEPRAHAHILTKDLGLALDMAAEAGVDSPLGAYALEVFRRTCALGWADRDDAAVLKTLSQDRPRSPASD